MMNATLPQKSPQQIIQVMSNLVIEHLRDLEAPAFWAWAKEDRVIFCLNGANLKNPAKVMSDGFAHNVSSQLGDVKVVRTNSIGYYYQVGYQPKQIMEHVLALSEQPGPLCVPIGMTEQGTALWPSILDLGSVLIAGPRGSGKTRLIHGWILALIHGGASLLYLYDGKDGLEFDRYASSKVHSMRSGQLDETIMTLMQLADERKEMLRSVRATSLPEYNQRVPEEKQMEPVVLVVDEAAFTKEVQAALGELIGWGRMAGIIPVLMSQRTSGEEVSPFVKANLVTRIAFRVLGYENSRVILGQGGAEKLRHMHLKMVMNDRMIEARVFNIDLMAFDPEYAPQPAGQIEPASPVEKPPIPSDELAVAEWIMANHGGRVSIPKLVQYGLSERQARTLIDRWARAGYIDGEGQGSSRKIAESLAKWCQSLSKCQSVKVCQSSEEPNTPGFGVENDDSGEVESENDLEG